MDSLSIIFFILFTLAAHWIAYRKGYFHLPPGHEKAGAHVTGLMVLAIFGTYLLTTVVLIPLLAKIAASVLKTYAPSVGGMSIQSITFVQLVLFIALFILLLGLAEKMRRGVLGKMWKDYTRKNIDSIGKDFWIGALTWLLGFPLVSVVGELIDWILTHIFSMPAYQQTAVSFVKKASSTPLGLIFAFISVVVLAPLVEEFLFRGTLQSYLKRKLGPKAAILLTALTFSLFHFATSQGLGNISLIFSLFILGCYLGFLYERQGSLYAPIGLHLTFNAISALRIILT